MGWGRGDTLPAAAVADRLIKKLGGERRGEATFFFGVLAWGRDAQFGALCGDLREELLQYGGHGFHAVRAPGRDVLFFAEVGREIVEFNFPEHLVGRNFPRAVAECERLRAVGSEVVAPEERARQSERLTGEEGQQARAVEGAVGGSGNLGECAGGREKIETTNRLRAGGAGPGVAGPTDDAGDVVPGFGDVEFHAAEWVE